MGNNRAKHLSEESAEQKDIDAWEKEANPKLMGGEEFVTEGSKSLGENIVATSSKAAEEWRTISAQKSPVVDDSQEKDQMVSSSPRRG